MSSARLPDVPSAEDFRALARSSPWRFTRVHFTHRQQDTGRTGAEGAVEAWLDRRLQRVTVRTPHGIEVAEGVPYGGAVALAAWEEEGSETAVPPSQRSDAVLYRPDGLVAERPPEWHYDHGDPMWRDYQWTAMLDPAELGQGVEITELTATVLRGRPTWAATCRPLVGAGEDWEGGYEPRCGCCPLLDSLASRLLEYGPDDPTLATEEPPTTYCVHLDVQTGIVVDVTALDGLGGSSLTNEIHDVDEPLHPPVR